MKKDIKKKWIKALRSGEFKQGNGELCNIASNEYCCLGVLCEITRQDNPQIKRTKEGHYSLHKKDSVDGQFDSAMLTYFGIAAETQNKLIDMNDERGKSFKEIADYIEEKL
jgi:hypothetical protein